MTEEETIDLSAAHLSQVSGVEISEDQAADLLGYAVAKGLAVGSRDLVNTKLTRKVKAIEGALEKILGQLSDGSDEAALIDYMMIPAGAVEQLEELRESAAHWHGEWRRDVAGAGAGRKRNKPLDDFVGYCRSIWVSAGGEGIGSYSKYLSDTHYDGPVLRLIKELLKIIDGTHPADATIHKSIVRAAKKDQVRMSKTD